MIAIIAGVFFAADDQTVVVTIIPSIMKDLNVGVTELNQVSWTITGYLLGYIAVMPIMGRLSDMFGRRHIYAVGMIIFMLGSVGTAMTGSMYWLTDSETMRNSYFGGYLDSIVTITSTVEWVVATRIFQSVGAGALIPVSIAMVADRRIADRTSMSSSVADVVPTATRMAPLQITSASTAGTINTAAIFRP